MSRRLLKFCVSTLLSILAPVPAFTGFSVGIGRAPAPSGLWILELERGQVARQYTAR